MADAQRRKGSKVPDEENCARQRSAQILPLFCGIPSTPSCRTDLSAELLRAAQARDHRDPQQILAGARRVGGDLAQPAPELDAVGFEVALVLDRLLLDMLERHQAALAVVAVELGFASLPRLDQARGQVD